MDISAPSATVGTVDAIVPCHNYGHLLAASVRSILSQAEVAVRVLILDDASTDQTAQVAAGLAAEDSRVEWRRHSVNHGHIATYNEGLQWVEAAHVLLLSADDLLTPGSLARAVRVMNARADVVMTYGPDLPFSTPEPPPIEPVTGEASCRIIDYSTFLEMSCQKGHTPLQAPAVLVRSSTHATIGGYLAHLPHSGDTEIWLRIASQGKVACIDEIQAFRRLHRSNMSHGYHPVQRLEEQLRAFETHLSDPNYAPRDAEYYRTIVRGTIAEAAFWTGAHAFERNQDAACTEALEFARSCDENIASTPSWSRMQWRRRLGPRTAGIVDRFYRRVRRTMVES
jgi:glycosyltransferase involved in cell wall biosynthesis